MESLRVIEKAIRHIPDLSFNSSKWDLSDVVCEAKTKDQVTHWTMFQRSNGSVVTYDKQFKFQVDVGYFYRGLAFVESAIKPDTWYLINETGSILITFPAGFPITYNKVKHTDRAILSLGEYVDLLNCHLFILRAASRKLEDHNYGFSKVAVDQKEGPPKCKFRNKIIEPNSCDFQHDLLRDFKRSVRNSLSYDEIWNFNDILGVCLVVDNKQAAFINRWFYRITPWFDCFLLEEDLEEMYGPSMSESDGIAVKIGEEIVFLKFAGDFLNDKFLNPLVFFSDQNRGREIYQNVVFPLATDDIYRATIEDDFGVNYNEKQVLLRDEFSILVERKGLNRSQIQSYIDEHNELMGVAYSGCEILKRLPYLRYQKDGQKGEKKERFNPYKPKHKVGPKFYYSWFKGI